MAGVIGMYEAFYKLHPTPFRLTPDPHFFFESETHKRGLAYLRFAFYQREGFVVITGAPGTGKTELMLNLINELPHHKVTLAKIVTSSLDADDLLDLVASSFAIDPEHLSKGSLLKKLEDYFVSQSRLDKQVLLLIDEAHNLSVKSLIELSMLSNFQIDAKPVMQCFLLGQQPLEEKLNLPDLTPLKQRVIASTRLETLDPQETREYILHRLSRSGWNNNPVILDDAFSLIHYFAKGVPRKINSICNRLLLQTFLDDRHEIGVDTVRQVIEEIQHEAIEQPLDQDFATIQATIKASADSTQNAGNQLILDRHSAAQPLKTSGDSQGSGNVIEIPEFIKRKENQITRKQLNTSHNNPDSRAFQSVPRLQEKNLATANASDGWINESNTDDIETFKHNTIKTQTVGLKTATSPTRKSESTQPEQYGARHHDQHTVSAKDTDHAAAKSGATPPASRPSGLLDKELQFLSSLQGPSIYSAHERKNADATAPATGENAQQNTKTARKVIIDESVYEDYGIRNGYDDEWEQVDSDQTALTMLNTYRRQISIVAIVLGILGLSIYWWPKENPGPVDQVAENLPQAVAAKDNVFANDILDTPTLDKKGPTPESTTPPEFAMDIDNSNNDIEPPFVTPFVTPLAASEKPPLETDNTPPLVEFSAIESSAIDASTRDGKPGRNELDKQLTLILEKNSTATIGAAANTGDDPAATSDHETATTSVSLASDKQTETGATKSSTMKAQNGNVGGSPAHRDMTPSTKGTAFTANSPHSTSPDSNAAAASDHATSGVIPEVVTRIQNTDITTAPAVTDADDANRSTTIHQAQPVISRTDLTALLSRLSIAYEKGSLPQLVRTFATDIYSSDGANRRQMEKEYQQLFDITDKRELKIRGVTWETKDKQMLGKGDFKVLIREKGATKDTTYEGTISLAVAKESNSIVIKKLDYDYSQ